MNRKYCWVAIVLMVVGFAAVSTTLFINGSTNIKANSEDFKVYYSDAKVNGVQDLTIVESETSLRFSTELDTLGQTYVIEYDVTNSSKNYDADLTMVCTGGDEYLTVNNVFDDVTNLAATETRVGTLTLTLAKTYTGADYDVDITCTITANAVERTSLGTGTPASPVEKVCYQEASLISGDGENPGDIISLCDQQFYVMDTTDTSVTMMSVLNVHPLTNKQSESAYGIVFKDDVGGYSGSDLESYINNYSSYLTNIGFTNTASAISESQLEGIYGCNFDSNNFEFSCPNTLPSWLIEKNYWIEYVGPASIRFAFIDGKITPLAGANKAGIRPVITVSKENLDDIFNNTNSEMDPQTFCESKGYTNGLSYEEYGGAYYEYDDGAYLCSNYENEQEASCAGEIYDINGNYLGPNDMCNM